MRGESREQPRTDAGDPIEAFQGAEGPLGFSVSHDGFGQRETHPGEAGQLGGARAIGIDSLARLQGASPGENAVTVGQRGLRWQGGEKLDLARRLAGPGDPPPNTLAGQAQREEQQEGAALGR